MPKRIVNAEELRRLGVPQAFIVPASYLAQRGSLDICPPPDLAEGISLDINTKIVACVEACTRKRMWIRRVNRSWKHFLLCKACHDLYKSEIARSAGATKMS